MITMAKLRDWKQPVASLLPACQNLSELQKLQSLYILYDNPMVDMVTMVTMAKSWVC